MDQVGIASYDYYSHADIRYTRVDHFIFWSRKPNNTITFYGPPFIKNGTFHLHDVKKRAVIKKDKIYCQQWYFKWLAERRTINKKTTLRSQRGCHTTFHQCDFLHNR